MIVVDTHVLVWWCSNSERLSTTAIKLITDADEIAVCAITWYELALLVERERIGLDVPVETMLAELAAQVRTIAIDWNIAHQAAGLESYDTFPRDPADRLIYAATTSVGAQLVTADKAMLAFNQQTCRW